MDPQPDQVGPSKNHQLFCNPEQPHNTLVMLKNIEHMDDLHQKYGNGQLVSKNFPNYFILNNITTAHKQKATLHAMLNQKTDPQIMIEQFCELARVCYPDKDKQMEINNLKRDFLGKSVIQVTGIIRWYTDQTFFYQLLNRLLRAGKDSTELYYGQHFTKLLSQALTQVYRKQKAQKRKQVSGNFECYRGATFSQNQIAELQNSVGKHIETLGFMSTSTDKYLAKQFRGNAFVEIEVASDAPKDEELDLGYAYLSGEYSKSPDEREVLFNVLSSFLVESVELVDNFWHIRLQYGVAYQMIHNHKQNKLQKNTAEQQLVLAILLYQNLFKESNNQEYCLLEQNAVDEWIWMAKTKISLCKSIPQLKSIGQSEQFDLYHKLTTNKFFEGKQQKLAKQIEPKYFRSIYEEKNNPSTIQMVQNMRNIFNLIQDYYHNKFFEEAESLIKKWREQKENLLLNIKFQYLEPHISPQLIEKMKQQQITVSVYEIMTNIRILDQKGDIQKLTQQIQVGEVVQQQLLTRYNRYHYLYITLRTCCQYSKHPRSSRQQFLEFQRQALTMVNGAIGDQQAPFQAKLALMRHQAGRHIQQKQWAEAVKVCAEFRDKHYKGREHQGEECFRPIIQSLDQNNDNMEIIQILQTFLSVTHPKHSKFYKFAEGMLRSYKQQQLQVMNNLHQIIAWPAKKQLTQLIWLKQEGLPLFEPKGSMLWITTQYLIVNAYKMSGKYKKANLYVTKLKQQYSAAKHRQFFLQQLQLFDN